MGLIAVVLFTAAIAHTPAHALPEAEVQLTPAVVAISGTTIAYAEIGEGPPLLLLNGTASPMSEWDPALLGALADNHRVIVLDYPGLGLSGPAPGRWTFEDGADWISDFIDAVSPGRPVDVLGWSMGGFIAQRLAVQHPSQVRRLVLASTNPGGDSAVLGPTWVQRADSRGTIPDYLRSNYPAGKRDLGRDFIRRLNLAVATGRYPDERVPRATAKAMVRAEDPWLRSNTNMHQLSRITAPTLVITGARDVITPPTNSRRIAEQIPGAQLMLIPDAGHSFLFQDPARTARVIRTFLSDFS